MSETSKVKGGQFLISDIDKIYTPEQFNEEQQMMAQSCQDFLDTEVLDKLDRIDALEDGLMPSLMEKAGEMGLLSISLPEKYNGFGGNFNTAIYTSEVLGGGHSFSVALAAHTGIGTLPVLYFGTENQKQHYLPKLATGEWKASYCLTEPGSGSDALSAKTRADLTPDGKHYILNGQKMWITNAGFADVFIVFAQLDGDKFTGFIVDKGTEGLSLGNEEHKMGIKGSSTRQVFFQDCKIPVENLLGEIGKGHLIAFNILNIGRIKLAAAALGASKAVIREAITYANERVQFKLPIARFGAIQHKLAQQAIEIYATESALYRASNDINSMEQDLVATGLPYEQAIQEAAKEFAIECALLKVSGSETLDFVTDEGVQILGGYGFSADYPMDRSYRDSRINRIFEGTNEINRLLIIDMFFKKAMKGQLDLMGPAMKIQAELMAIPEFGSSEATLFSEEEKAIQNIKKATIMVAGAAAQKFMQKLSHEQEIIMNASDMIIQLYQAESTLLRTKQMVAEKGEKEAEAHIAMTKTYIYDVIDKVNKYGKDAINSFATGDEQRMMLLGLKRFTKIAPFNTKDARRLIANKMIEANKFVY
jgi:alkylation response protein AidB-like acyl-CoA dehydrogenase